MKKIEYELIEEFTCYSSYQVLLNGEFLGYINAYTDQNVEWEPVEGESDYFETVGEAIKFIKQKYEKI